MELLIEQVSMDELISKVREAVAEEFRRHSEEEKQPKGDDVLLSRNETAKILGVTLPTLHRYTRAGYVKAYRIGSKTVKYKKSEIEKSLNEIQNLKYKQRA